MTVSVSHALFEKHKKGNEEIIIVNFSVLKFDDDFAATFKAIFEVTWLDMTTTFASRWMVYLIMDEVQAIYQEEGTSSPRIKPSVSWNVVKDVMSDQNLNFRHDEVMGYTKKCLHGASCLLDSQINGTSAIEVFCANLEYLTGCHVGLCVQAIASLNSKYVPMEERQPSSNSFGVGAQGPRWVAVRSPDIHTCGLRAEYPQWCPN
uniref:Uncharacterized protein n=1 Tax=Globisporangium ultimum (strain ATCC 200006 / CBS 805.95 / DAOM BR144) TaxID=431595 RepID=K3WSB0_GLOUD